MNDEELDVLVASVSPIDERHVAELPLARPAADLMEAIMSTPPPGAPAVPVRSVSRRPWRLLVPVAAAVALIAGFAGSQGVRDGSTAWAAEVVAVAEAAPRLVVDRPGWSVSRADEFSISQGEMTFTDGSRELDVHWVPADRHDATVADRASSSDLHSRMSVVGRDAVLLRYEGTTDFVALWRHGDHSVEARGVFTTIEDFRAVLGSLIEVDVDTWLEAMPDSVVKPASRAVAVDQMLADIPLPDGFDRTTLRSGEAVQDRYQLGATVAGAAACSWIEGWIVAVDAGDAAAAKRAVDAMSTSHNWRVLVDMDDEGHYPEVIWELADAMATGAPVSGGRPMTIRESYSDSLGCGQL